jgi:hypothetical protein
LALEGQFHFRLTAPHPLRGVFSPDIFQPPPREAADTAIAEDGRGGGSHDARRDRARTTRNRLSMRAGVCPWLRKRHAAPQGKRHWHRLCHRVSIAVVCGGEAIPRPSPKNRNHGSSKRPNGQIIRYRIHAAVSLDQVGGMGGDVVGEGSDRRG